MKIYDSSTNTSKIIGFSFVSVALFFTIIVTGITIDNLSTINSYIKTQGIVDEMVSDRKNLIPLYAPVIFYRDNERKVYKIVGSSYTFIKPKIGKIVEVAYNSEDPSEAVILSSGGVFFLPLLSSLLLTPFYIIGIFFIVSYFRNKAKKISLIKKRNMIFADLVKIKMNMEIRAKGGKHPYIIYARGKVGQKEIVFESDPVWFDPEIVFPDGKIPVFVDFKDPENYYVDIRKGFDFKSQKSLIG